MLQFRDRLRRDPQALQEYDELKKGSSLLAGQDGKAYRTLKEPFIKKFHRQ